MLSLRTFLGEIIHMNMMAFSAGLAVFFSASVFAQHALVGKYTGSFAQSTRQGDVHAGLTLEILTVEGDTVKGTAVRGAAGPVRACAGEYPVEGTLKDNSLVLKATRKGGPAGDCNLTLRLTVEGNKLVGTLLKYPAQLSK